MPYCKNWKRVGRTSGLLPKMRETRRSSCRSQAGILGWEVCCMADRHRDSRGHSDATKIFHGRYLATVLHQSLSGYSLLTLGSAILSTFCTGRSWKDCMVNPLER